MAPHERPTAYSNASDQRAIHTSGIADREPVYSSSYHQGSDSPVALGDALRDDFEPHGKLYSGGKGRSFSAIFNALVARGREMK